MNRQSPLLLTILLVVTVLGHSAHNAIASPRPDSSAATSVSTAAIQHAHGPLNELRILDHGALADLSPEICTVGDQSAPATMSGVAQLPILAHDARGEAPLPVSPSVPAYDVSTWPPDVRRALLQVFLNWSLVQ